MFDMVTKFDTSMVNKIEVKNDIIKSMKLDVFGDLQASPVQLSIITKPKYGPKSLVVNSNYWNTIIFFSYWKKMLQKIFIVVIITSFVDSCTSWAKRELTEYEKMQIFARDNHFEFIQRVEYEERKIAINKKLTIKKRRRFRNRR